MGGDDFKAFLHWIHSKCQQGSRFYDIVSAPLAYFKFIIPANTYPNQPTAVQTFAVANYIFARKDLPEDLVYKFTKAIYEHSADLVATHKAAKDIKKENAVNGMTVPLHPGAAKYLKEIGAVK